MRMRVDICIRCIIQRRGYLSMEDKRLIKERTIVCPEHKDGEALKEPPETCPWRLEHVIDGETPNGSDDFIDYAGLKDGVKIFEKNGSGIFVPT